MRVKKVLPRESPHPVASTVSTVSTSSTRERLTIPQVLGIRLALVGSTLAMSDFANNVIGALLFSVAFGGLIIGASLIVFALVPPRKKDGRQRQNGCRVPRSANQSHFSALTRNIASTAKGRVRTLTVESQS
jgi:hypothetical protein